MDFKSQLYVFRRLHKRCRFSYEDCADEDEDEDDDDEDVDDDEDEEDDEDDGDGVAFDDDKRAAHCTGFADLLNFPINYRCILQMLLSHMMMMLMNKVISENLFFFHGFLGSLELDFRSGTFSENLGPMRGRRGGRTSKGS